MLSISIEGTEGYNDKMRGDGTFRLAMRTALHAHALRIPFGINFTLTKENLQDIPFLVKIFEKKAETITFSRFIPFQKNDAATPLSPSDYEKVGEMLSHFRGSRFKHRQEGFLDIGEKKDS